MSIYVIAGLILSGVVGWFIPMWSFGIVFGIAWWFYFDTDDIGKFFVFVFAAIIIVGGLSGSGLRYYLDKDSNTYIKDGKHYELQYVEVNSTNSVINTQEPESTFWHDFKTYRPFKD